MGVNRPDENDQAKQDWEFEDRYAIESWENSLTLPAPEEQHPPELLSLEKQIQFTYTGSGATEVYYVFVSPKTDLMKLLKYLPFLFKEYKLFHCGEQLIQERLRFLEQDSIFQGENSANINLQYILEQAADTSASDIHIESLSDSKRIRMRVDGELVNIEPPELLDDSVLSKIKLHSGMDITKKRTPQDGHFQFISQNSKRFDLRVSTIPGIYGEKIVIRLLPTSTVSFSLVELGFQDDQIELLQRSLISKTGMVLITGPTGSGKTTTLYAILKELKSENINIMTIEDPVEYRFEGITQVEVNELSGLTFSSALRSFLRQDPDVILVGEIRDLETAQIAARAAQTGHLVLSTLHSNNVFESIHRLKGLGVEPDDLSSSLKLLLSQRLLPRRCSCESSENCARCLGKGYYGRIPVMEALFVDDDIRRALAFGVPISEIEKIAETKGFTTLRGRGEKMILRNIITRRDLDAVC